jgi:arginase family enzyme
MEHGWQGVLDRLAALPPGPQLTVLGGDHCSAVPVLGAQARRHPGLALLWADAHPDLCNFSRGGAWTCGCALRRALEVAGLDPALVVLVGSRDFDPEEVDFIAEQGITLIPAARLARDPEGAALVVADVVGGHPLHISFDIDVLDPAFAPGTEIPSAGGVSTRTALDLLAELAGRCRLVGLDVMEVSPPHDLGDITSLAALKVVFEYWGLTWTART